MSDVVWRAGYDHGRKGFPPIPNMPDAWSFGYRAGKDAFNAERAFEKTPLGHIVKANAEGPKKSLADLLNPDQPCLCCGVKPFLFDEVPQGIRCRACGTVTESAEDGIGREL